MAQLKDIQREELTAGAIFIAKADGQPHTIGNIAENLRYYARYEMLPPGRTNGSYLTLYIVRRLYTRQ